MRRTVIFLQNAWSPAYAGKVWPRDSWLRALERSRSGKMVKLLTADLSICENTTPMVGDRASSKLPPDYVHIAGVIVDRQPDVVVCCGLQAIDALEQAWPGPMLQLPHPATRWVSKDLYLEGKRLLDLMTKGRMNFRARLWQKKGEPFKINIIPMGGCV